MSEGDLREFDFQDRLGLFLTVLGASISLICVTGILLYAVYNSQRKDRVRHPDASDSSIFLNLMFADLIQATGVMFNIRWMDDGIITQGGVCKTQAAMKQIGINGVSATSLAITVYTFAVLVFCWNPPKYVAIFIISSIWIFTGLVVGIPNAIHKNDVYYMATDRDFWCWIPSTYRVEQIVTEYLWVWITGLSMLILYPLMYLVVREWVIIDNGIYWRWNYTSPGPEMQPQKSKDDEMARKLLYYPVVYIVCVLPNSISRWKSFTGPDPPHKFILFANTLFALSGFFNFLVFYHTRKAMVLGEDVGGHDDLEMVPIGNRAEGFLPQNPLPANQNNNASPTADNPPSAGGSSDHKTTPTRQQMEDRERGFLPP